MFEYSLHKKISFPLRQRKKETGGGICPKSAFSYYTNSTTDKLSKSESYMKKSVKRANYEKFPNRIMNVSKSRLLMAFSEETRLNYRFQLNL